MILDGRMFKDHNKKIFGENIKEIFLSQSLKRSYGIKAFGIMITSKNSLFLQEKKVGFQ